MLIGIDASRAVSKQKTGTEYYSYEIIKNILNIDHADKFVLYAPHSPAKGDSLLAFTENTQWRIIPLGRLWSQLRLSWELLFHRPRPYVMFEPAHTIPLFAPGKMVVTVHDLGFIHFPKLYSLSARIYHRFCMRFSVRRAKQIIAISEFTKKDIVDYYKVDPAKITVIHLGVNFAKFSPSGPSKNLPFNIKAPYILYTGRLEAKKNIINLIKGFNLVREKVPNLSLVLAGKRGYGWEAIKKTINQLPKITQEKIIQPGYINDEEYILLLQNAAVFSLISNFEGFGLPILEAMACGVPVVCSDTTSLPEIAGEAAILVAPKKPEEIARAFAKIVLNEEIRKQLIAAGLKRVEQFSWTEAAKKTLAVLKNTF